MNTVGFKTEESRLEEGLGSTESGFSTSVNEKAQEADYEPLVADGDDLTIRELIALLEG